MPEKKSSPMRTQPIDEGRGMPQQMTSWVKALGPKQPERNDKAICAEARGNSLKKQREALRK